MTDDTWDFERLPGLFRVWDLPLLLQPGRDYRLDACGPTEDGTPLFSVFCRDPEPLAPVGADRP